ncbi:MAG: hypothetical protein QM730_03795 [Anaerolineales bacterium]
METQPLAGEKKSFLQNDRLLVCSMLVFYGVCILGAIGAAFFWVRWDSQRASTNATATAAVVATKQAQITATANARLAEQDQYEYIERFDKISGDWFVGEDKSRYGDVMVSIKDGVYVWEINDAKGYIQGEDFYRKSTALKDYDIYVDIKFEDTVRAEDTCGGLTFRKSISGWDGGVYIFYICDDAYYGVEYFESDTWDTMQEPTYSDAILTRGWNRMEVSAIGDHFIFTINNRNVLETRDTRHDRGGVGLYIDAPDGSPTVVLFDNFGFQSR